MSDAPFKRGDIVEYINARARNDMVGSLGIVIDPREGCFDLGINWIVYLGDSYKSDTHSPNGWQKKNVRVITHATGLEAEDGN